MTACGRELLEELRGPGRDLRRMIPEVYAGFAALHDGAIAPNQLDSKTKELIALALSVSQRCDGCIAAHARAAAEQGATAAEVAETLGVLILMNGGPATVYGPRALDAFRGYQEAELTQGTLVPVTTDQRPCNGRVAER